MMINVLDNDQGICDTAATAACHGAGILEALGVGSVTVSNIIYHSAKVAFEESGRHASRMAWDNTTDAKIIEGNCSSSGYLKAQKSGCICALWHRTCEGVGAGSVMTSLSYILKFKLVFRCAFNHVTSFSLPSVVFLHVQRRGATRRHPVRGT